METANDKNTISASYQRVYRRTLPARQLIIPLRPAAAPAASLVAALSQDAGEVLFSTRYDQDCGGFRNCKVLGYHG